MCRFCTYVDDKIAVLKERQRTMKCFDTGKTRIRHPERKEYWQKQYRASSERRKKAALDRYYEKRSNGEV